MVVRGGDGNDVITTGNGKDRIFGGSGADTINGQGQDDAIVGGTGKDSITGGSGDDRFVDKTWRDSFLFFPVDQWQDTIVDRQSNDARIGFRDGDEETVAFGGQNGLYTFAAANWSQAEIETVDSALEVLHRATNNTRLLKKHDGGDVVFVRQGGNTNSEGGTFNAAAWNDSGTIHMAAGAFDTANDTRQTAIHEIGHNFDEEFNASTWRALSGWTRDDKSNDPNYRRGGDASGNWWHLRSASFASNYARTNPNEDFAETFASVFMRKGGFGTSLAEVAAKRDFMNNMVATLS
jgi:hypothetical protein